MSLQISPEYLAIPCALTILLILAIDRFHPLIPLFFPKKADDIRKRLRGVVDERFEVVVEHLSLDLELRPPTTTVDFVLHFPMARHKQGEIILSSKMTGKTIEKIQRAADHEIAHYVQHVMNPENVKPGTSIRDELSRSWMNLEWFVMRRMNKPLAEKAFTEGFAEYVSSITSGPNELILRSIPHLYASRWRLVLSVTLPYALGYLVYRTIAQNSSREKAIQIGLCGDALSWREEGRRAIRRQGGTFAV